MRGLVLCALIALTACKPETMQAAAQPDPLLSGSHFLTTETRALQNDEFANPGYLWVEKGAQFFNDSKDGPACASCHGPEQLSGAAATYPKYDEAMQALTNIEGRINQCRIRHQNQPPLPYEHDQLLSLSAYIANLSRGAPLTLRADPRLAKHIEAGRDYYFTRRGQFNLSCAQCHNDNSGKKLRGDTISQGHGNGFPAYRFEWEGLGSLHRRFADCDRGVRAEPMALGSQTYLDLELYLAWRGRGLAIETPAVRR